MTIDLLQSVYSFLMVMSASALLPLGVIFIFVKPPHKEKFKPIRHIGIALAICYIVLSLVSYISAVTGYDPSVDNVSLEVGAFQATFLTVAMVVLINPQMQIRRFIKQQSVFILLLPFIMIPSFFVESLAEMVVIRLLAGVCYGLQCWFCVRKFYKSYNDTVRKLDEAYDDSMEYRLRWSKWGFYGGLIVGVMAYITLWIGELSTLVFVSTYMVYYTILSIYFIKYIIHIAFYEPVISDNDNVRQSPYTEKMTVVKSVIDKWIESKGYIDEKPTADIATELNISLSSMREYVKSKYGEDFRTWRTRLRIKEACAMLCSQPELPIISVGERCGIPNKGNFHIYFVRFTGMTPTQYRETQSNKEG